LRLRVRRARELLGRGLLRAAGETQDDADARVLAAIARFVTATSWRYYQRWKLPLTWSMPSM
jgi:hypothetical protein